MIYMNNNQDLEDDQEWFEGLDSVDKPDMNEAVKIQDPVSSMHLAKPLIVDLGTSLRHVLDTMQNNKRNCVVTLKNDKLGGILTERDILLKVTGKGYDLDLTVIDEFITLSPDYVTPDDPLAYALNKMHIGGYRNVPVVNDELYPIGVISITDIISTIAEYFHSEIINLPSLDKIVDKSTQEGG